MAKVKQVRSNFASQHPRTAPHVLSCRSSKGLKPVQTKHKKVKSSNKNELDKATCSVCLEYPHNAVLLLCSAHDKGCRPYMCATGRRYSNCLEQYKKAYMKLKEVESTSRGNVTGDHEHPNLANSGEKVQVPELLCPLCRGQVKGYTVVEMSRRYFNGKKRMCMQETCTFSGNYKQLRKHMHMEHSQARPWAVDPAHEEKWKRLVQQRERNDVISTIVSTTPGAVVLGDYVIEQNPLFIDYDWEGYSSDDLTPLENLGRQYVTSALMYGDVYDPIEEDLDLSRSWSTRAPLISSRTCSRYLNNRLRRRGRQ